MTTTDPIALMFADMEKLGPGSDEDTLAVLHALPRRDFRTVVDAGCGSGRQTLALAQALDVTVHALDTYEPFLHELADKARRRALEDRVQTHCLGMESLARHFSDIDLLWSEASAYSIGLETALRDWRQALAADGILVVSELCWLQPQAPAEAQAFWQGEYPDMRSEGEVIELAQGLGYRLLGQHPLPKRTWFSGYYDVLGPRARELVHHEDPSVREMAAGVLHEIDVVERYHGSFGYSFFSLQRA